jgi:hypothetical protein
MGFWKGQSRLGRSIVTSMATAQVASATNFTTNFAAQTYQVRVTSTLPLWATIGSTAVITANSSAAFIPANTPGYFAVTSGQVLKLPDDQYIDGLCRSYGDDLNLAERP